ncbi:hypothetical protein IHE44_0001805, partial [Lamprotornis superbus]
MDCHQYTNRSCEECLKNVTCLWCASSRRCMEYPVRRILPPADLCELRSARWGVCWDKDDERAAREREKRRVRQEERRAEMKSRHDEIRRKYVYAKTSKSFLTYGSAGSFGCHSRCLHLSQHISSPLKEHKFLVIWCFQEEGLTCTFSLATNMGKCPNSPTSLCLSRKVVLGSIATSVSNT